MIKKLRKKFILLSTISLLLLLGIIVISSNFLTYRELVANADMVLSMLASNKNHFTPLPVPDQRTLEYEGIDKTGAVSEINDSGVSGSEGQDTALPEKRKKDDKIGKFGKFWFDRRMSPEIMYESRFFTVNMSFDGQIKAINTERIVMVDDDAAREYAMASFHKKSVKGFIGDFRYTKIMDNNDIYVIFLDCGRNLFTFKRALLTNCLISFTGLLVIFVFIVMYSKRIVQPVSESYEKQKQFISVAGHEIKTPITIIDADAEILSMEIGEENEWLQDICVQTKRMTALTNDLLSLSRMDEHRQQFHMIDFPISDVVGETVQSFQALARSKGKSICAYITPMLSYHGDEGSIRQITGILLDNAIKYTKEEADGSSMDIELTLEKKSHNIILSVKNSSEPVSEEQLRQFFDRFYRTEQSRDSEKGGYGLGLSIAKSMVEAHKGKISAASPAVNMVQVTVTLPLRGR